MSGSILVVTFDTATGIRTGRLVGSALLEDQAVTSGKLASGIVGTVHLRDLAVTSAKVADALIATIEAGVVDGGVTSAKLASGIVGSVHLADEAVASGDIKALAVGAPHLAALAVLSSHIGANEIGKEHIMDANIVSAAIASGIIAGVHIKDASILSGELGSGIVGDALLKDFGLLSGKYASGSITEQALVSGISIDVAETTKEPGYRAAVIMSAYDPVYVAAVSGNYVGIAIALSGTMPAIGIAAANIASGSLGDINYGGRAPAPAIVSGQYGRPVFVGASGTGLTMTPPSTSGYSQQIMGAVKDDDEIFLFPEPGYIEIA